MTTGTMSYPADEVLALPMGQLTASLARRETPRPLMPPPTFAEIKFPITKQKVLFFVDLVAVQQIL